MKLKQKLTNKYGNFKFIKMNNFLNIYLGSFDPENR